MEHARPFASGFTRGLKGRCPNCGEGRLFRGYLKVSPTCEACGHATGEYRADDGPAYFTILIVGHLFIAPIVLMPIMHEWSPVVLCATLLPAMTLITLGLLRVTKGGLIGVLWSTRAGSAQ